MATFDINKVTTTSPAGTRRVMPDGNTYEWNGKSWTLVPKNPPYGSTPTGTSTSAPAVPSAPTSGSTSPGSFDINSFAKANPARVPYAFTTDLYEGKKATYNSAQYVYTGGRWVLSTGQPGAPTPAPLPTSTTPSTAPAPSTTPPKEGDKKVVNNLLYIYSATSGWVQSQNYTAPGTPAGTTAWKLPVVQGYTGPTEVKNPTTGQTYYLYITPGTSTREWHTVPLSQAQATYDSEQARTGQYGSSTSGFGAEQVRKLDEERAGVAQLNANGDTVSSPASYGVVVGPGYYMGQRTSIDVGGVRHDFVWNANAKVWVEVGSSPLSSEAMNNAIDPNTGKPVPQSTTGTSGAGQGTSGVILPKLPDVGAPYNYTVPSIVQDIRDEYGNVIPPENLGAQRAGYYDDIKYQEDTENINRLYDDMMKLYNWDEVKQEVLREGAIGNRMAAAANAAAGRGLGGSFLAGQSQADINTQGALMAKKMDFLNNLTAIQQKRAEALAVEHQLGQKYGIELGELQAGIKSDEDKAIRDAIYNLELSKVGAVTGQMASEQSTEAGRLGAQAAARSGGMLHEYDITSQAALDAANKEPAYVDVTTKLGVGARQDPNTGWVEITGTGQKVSPTAYSAISKIEGQIKWDKNIIDIRSDLATWAAGRPDATETQIMKRASELFYNEFLEIAKQRGEGNPTQWAKDKMKDAFGPTWETSFQGVLGNSGYRYVQPVTTQV